MTKSPNDSTKKQPKSPKDVQTDALMEEVRLCLLRLHKALLDDERAEYERLNGPIGASSRLLSLVMSDPWFDWLHTLSRIVIRIDQMTESKDLEPQALMQLARETLTELRTLVLPFMGPAGASSVFADRYKAVLKRNAGAVLAHAALLKSIDSAEKHLRATEN